MDDLRKQSDKELKKIEDEIERIYKDAEGDLREKWTAYMDRAEKRVASYGKAYSDAVKSGDADAIAAAKAALNKKIESVTIRDKQFADMVDAVTDRMANVNQLAADYVNGQMPRMYSYNYNGSLREVQKDADAAGISGIAFNMIDDATVERMQKRGEVTLPKRKIDVPKDKQWNRKAINAQIMQGIIQGESIPQMSKRLREVTDMNKNSSIRNARTLTTEAENGGRLDSMKTASDMGLEYEKTWIATHDERTRLSHALIDGESVPLDEKFSNGLQYPADPSGPPEEVYNCRCSLVRKLIGYKGHAIDDIGSYEPTYFDDVKAEAAANKPSEDELHETAEAFAEETQAETIDVDSVIPENVRKTIDDFYDKFTDAKTEHYLAINKDGKIIFESGNQRGKSNVSVPQAVNKANEGGYSIHNHPAPVTFSAEDIKNYEMSGQHGFVVDKSGNEYILYNKNPVSKYKEIDAIPITDHYDEDWEKIMPFTTSVQNAFEDIEERIAKERREYFAEIQETVADRADRSKLAQEWIRQHSADEEKIKWLEENAKDYGFVFEHRKKERK